MGVMKIVDEGIIFLVFGLVMVSLLSLVVVMHYYLSYYCLVQY